MALEPPGEEDEIDMANQKTNADEEYDNANDAGMLTNIVSHSDTELPILSLVWGDGFLFT